MEHDTRILRDLAFDFESGPHSPPTKNVIRYRPFLNKVSPRLRLKISSALFYFVRYMIYDEN